MIINFITLMTFPLTSVIFFVITSSDNPEIYTLREMIKDLMGIIFPPFKVDFLINVIPFFSFGRIFLFLLLLGVFITHSGEFTRFLHRLGFLYFLLYIWFEFSGIIQSIGKEKRTSLTFLETIQADSLFFRFFYIYITIIVIIFFFGVAERYFFSQKSSVEFAFLVLFIHIGGLFALYLNTLRDLFLALERVTLSSYVLVTYERHNRFSTYAGVQYFLLGSLPTARLVLSFGIFYLHGGSLVLQDLDLLFGYFITTNAFFVEGQSHLVSQHFQSIINHDHYIEALKSSVNLNFISDWKFFELFSTTIFNEIDNQLIIVQPLTALPIRALFFLLFNLLFKLTAAPFHIWAPSVYGNAPIASVTFLSIYSKALVLFFIFKLFNTFLHTFSFVIFNFFIFCSILSIFIGRVGAFTEKKIKRFFVFSSMGHVGFRLIGLGLFTIEGASSTFHYLFVYILSSFIRWFLLLVRGRDKHHLNHFSFLKNTNPVLALIFAFLVFSRSGIPPFGGFFIKLDVLSVLLDNSHFFINYILFFFTVASFFYYLRLIKIIFFDSQNTQSVSIITQPSISFSNELPRYVGRIWIRIFLFLILSFYLFIIQKPLLVIQLRALSSLF